MAIAAKKIRKVTATDGSGKAFRPTIRWLIDAGYDVVNVGLVLARDRADHFAAAHAAVATGGKKFPAPIFGMYRLRPRRGKRATNELKRYVQEPRFRAALVNTCDDGITLDDRAPIDHLIRAASDLHMPVVFRPMKTIGRPALRRR